MNTSFVFIGLMPQAAYPYLKISVKKIIFKPAKENLPIADL